MTEEELHAYIRKNYPRENESCEWKGWRSLKNQTSGKKGEDLISYVSGLANMEGGVIVLGVKDQTCEIIGIEDFHDYTPENLPFRIRGNCPNLSSVGCSVNEFITSDTLKKVWVFHVPKHLPRQPVHAHKMAWQRQGDNLTPLTEERLQLILNEPLLLHDDWSREICPNAGLKDLSPLAIQQARINYGVKNPSLKSEMSEWSDTVFLNKAKLLINGQVTRTAIILLGLPESTHYLNGAQAHINWILKNQDNIELDYAHLGPPFLLNVEKVYSRIRNLKYRYMQGDSIFPEEIDMYDPFVIRESLHNAIAHQDYLRAGRIIVVEHPNKLSIVNEGSFTPGSVSAVIERDAPQTNGRNRFLLQAMFNMGMIDTIGSGIKRMFVTQRNRFFPMPDYDLSNQRVKITIYGKVLDIEYARLLAKHQDLSLSEIILLDRVQKHLPISRDNAKLLRKRRYIEGRNPNYHISASLATITDDRASYIKNKAFDNDHYKQLIISYLNEFKVANRKEVDELLYNKFSELLNEEQRSNKVSNLLSALRREGKISNLGSATKPKWVLVKL